MDTKVLLFAVVAALCLGTSSATYGPCGRCPYGKRCVFQDKKFCDKVPVQKKVCNDVAFCKEIKTPCGSSFCKFDSKCIDDILCTFTHGHSKVCKTVKKCVPFGLGVCKEVPKKDCFFGDKFFCKQDKVCKKVPRTVCTKTPTKVCSHHKYGQKCFSKLVQKCDTVFAEECNVVYFKCPFHQPSRCGRKICDPGFKCISQQQCKKITTFVDKCIVKKVPTCY